MMVKLKNIIKLFKFYKIKYKIYNKNYKIKMNVQTKKLKNKNYLNNTRIKINQNQL